MNPKQKIGNGMRGDGISQSVFTNDQALVKQSTQYTRQPFIVSQTE